MLVGVSTPQSVRVTFGDDYGPRLEKAVQDGRIINKAGLAKAAYGHAMQHGQAATEALLRNGTTPADPPSTDAAELVGQLRDYVASLERKTSEHTTSWSGSGEREEQL
jgi:hypothetical protein